MREDEFGRQCCGGETPWRGSVAVCEEFSGTPGSLRTVLRMNLTCQLTCVGSQGRRDFFGFKVMGQHLWSVYALSVF